MKPIEIIVIISAILFVGLVFGKYIYKKAKHMPTGECACCANKGKNLVNLYHKKYK